MIDEFYFENEYNQLKQDEMRSKYDQQKLN